jgi:hypothetical protein
MRSRALALVVAFVAIAAPARAQQSEADKLFDEGAALMKQQKYADACPKFEQSNKLDPQVGGLLWLADCYEKNGQTASAYKTYKDAQKMAIERKDKQQRDKVAQKHIGQLEGHLTKLTILAPQEGKPEGLEVMRDGEKLGVSDLGLAVPLDPGMHVVSATAPKFKAWEKKLEVSGDGNTVTVTVGPLEKEESAAPPPPHVVEEGDPGTTFHVAGLVVGLSGLVAIGIGSAFGVIAMGKLSDSNANNHCDAADTCDATGLGLRSDAKDAALISTILFVAGGVAVAAGVTIFVLAPKKKHAALAHVAPAVGPGFYGLSLGGSF